MQTQPEWGALEIGPEVASTLRANRRFVLLLAGEAVSVVALSMFSFSVIAEATFRYQADAAQLGTLGLVSSAAFILGAAVGGTAADRLRPKWILVAANAAVGIAILFAISSTGFGHLVVAMIPFSLGNGAMGPSRSSLLRDTLASAQLVRGNALISVVWEASLIPASLVAGVLGARGAARWSFLIALVLQSIGLALFIRIRPGRRSQWAPNEGSIWSGVNETWYHPRIRLFVGLALIVWFLTESLLLLEPLIVRDSAGLGEAALGLFWSLRGLGGLMGVAVLAVFAGRLRDETSLVAASAGATGLAWIGFAATGSIAMMGAAAVACGAGLAIQLPLARAYLQRVPQRVGQVQAVFAVTTELGAIGAAIMVSKLKDTSDVKDLFTLIGISLVASGAVGAFLLSRTMGASADRARP